MSTAPLAASDRLDVRRFDSNRFRGAASRGRAIVGSILGNIAILAVLGVALLVVPVAAALAFGAPLLEYLR